MASVVAMSNRKSAGVPTESQGYSTVTRWAGSYLRFRKPGNRRTRLQSVASGIAAEGDGEQLESAFLRGEVEAFDAPKHLVLTLRCREDCRGNRHGIRRPERSEPGVSVRVDVYIEVANRCDALFRPPTAAGAKRIGGDVDVRTGAVLVREPGEIARRKRLLQSNDALRRSVGTLAAEQGERSSPPERSNG